MKSFLRTAIIALTGICLLAGSAAADSKKLSKRLDEIRAKYVTTMGMYDQLRADVETLSVLPNAKEISGVSGDQFTSALKTCWEQPIESVKGAKREAIDIGRAAKAFKDRTAMKGLKDTEIEVSNARNAVNQCKPAAMDSVKGQMGSMNDAAKSALDNKVSLIDQIRILSKHELPTRAKSLTEATAKIQGEVIAELKTAEAKAKAAKANPLGGGKKAKKEVKRLKSVQVQADELMKLVQTEMTAMPKELTSTTTNIVKNITDVGALIQ